MQPVLSNYAASITELKKSPTQLLKHAGDPAILISDNTKIKNAMHWKLKYDDLEVICQNTLDWGKKNS